MVNCSSLPITESRLIRCFRVFMILRREINSKHEHAVIDSAIRAHNERTGDNFSVESRPDPPDAILIDGDKRIWIEHTDVFYDSRWAEDLTSYAATDRDHRPMRKGPHMDMDDRVADNFVEVVLNKFKKDSYKSVVEELGAGILVVGLESPWLDEKTIQAINAKWNEIGNPDLSSIFRWIYLGDRVDGENRTELWEYT